MSLESALRSANRQLEFLQEERRWRPIETAPRDGAEILGWREDSGVMLVRFVALIDLIPHLELDEPGICGETLEAPDWFYADFVDGGRLEGDEIPTHWVPLPEGMNGGNQ